MLATTLLTAASLSGLSVPMRNAQAQTGTSPQRAASPIQHVVAIFMENHTFDNVLGFWCDDHPGRCPKGGMPASVTLKGNIVVTPSDATDHIPEIDHNVASQQAAIDGGKMDGWAEISDGTCNVATHYQCISGFEPKQIPNLTRLAQHYAISDHTFSISDSASWAGHIAIASASMDSFTGDNPRSRFPPASGWGCDSKRLAPWKAPDGTIEVVPTCVPDPSLNPAKHPYGGAFEPTPAGYVPTIMDRLDAAGLSWRIYGATKGTYGYGIWDICPTFAECLYTKQHRHLVPDAQFLTDAGAGTLPNYSVVTPGGPDFVNSCHNNMSMTACDNWVGQLVSAVQNGPDWNSTAIFIAFDDCGCFYDHVSPPIGPTGLQEGPRVPMIIVSPYARPGYTDSKSATFAGILAFIEHNFGVTPLSPIDANAYDFRYAFSYSQAPLKAVHMVDRPLPAAAKHIHLTQAMKDDPT